MKRKIIVVNEHRMKKEKEKINQDMQFIKRQMGMEWGKAQ